MPEFRKKPVEVTAFRLPPEDEDGTEELIEFLNSMECEWGSESYGSLYICTLEGDMLAGPGDWIIRGVNGEFYPCKHDIFMASYDPI